MPLSGNPRSSKKQTFPDRSKVFNSNLRPWVKWPGGKSGELPHIIENAPKAPINRFIEPFVGGGSVLLAVDPSIPAAANDVCPELIQLYEGGANHDLRLKTELSLIATAWESLGLQRENVLPVAQTFVDHRSTLDTTAQDLFNNVKCELENLVPDLVNEMESRLLNDLPKKLDRVLKLQIKHGRDLPLSEMVDNILGSLHAAFYMAVRKRYNEHRLNNTVSKTRAADFFFLREFSYASMFRFNARGEFNVPYGGISYNKKSFITKVDALFNEAMKQRLSNTQWHCSDFKSFLEDVEPSRGDFMFVDPPYDSDFSDYDNREFNVSDQRRLAEFLESLDCKMMVVIGDTPVIRNAYSSPKWRIDENPKLYNWNIKGRNDRAKTHLVITNYL
jgi:DNA adenine methylase